MTDVKLSDLNTNDRFFIKKTEDKKELLFMFIVIKKEKIFTKCKPIQNGYVMNSLDSFSFINTLLVEPIEDTFF